MTGTEVPLATLRSLAHNAADATRQLDLAGAAIFASHVEEMSRAIEYLQIVAAGRLERARNAGAPAGAAPGWLTGWSEGSGPDGAESDGSGSDGAGAARAAFADEFRSTGDYLRVLLRISAAEARRRLALAGNVLPRQGITGQQLEPVCPDLATAVASATVSSRAATVITLSLDKVPRAVPAETVAQMEKTLTTAALDNDPDFVGRLAKRLLDALDPDGAEPSEVELRRFQGAFIRKPKNGLNHLEIFATQDQYENLLTVMNAASNPRNGPGSVAGAGAADPETARPEAATDVDATDVDATAALDRRSRPQKLLDGLVGACQSALACGGIPSNGGFRPQIMATIGYEQLLGLVTGVGTSTGTHTFTGPVSAAALRKLSCDADIIPVVLGGEGQILDIGRASRLFPPHLRKAIAARDQGCAFPGCTMPIPWCEAHHITYWSQGGASSVDNGTLLCSHHHHVIHKEQWSIEVRTGVPWFIPPPHVDPRQKPRRNHYFRC